MTIISEKNSFPFHQHASQRQTYEFTKQHTAITKGAAILLMLYHHLFGFPDRLQYHYLSIFGSVRINELFGSFGKLCVALYLLISGYVLYCSSMETGNFTFRNAFRKIKKFYILYLVIFLIFIPCGFLFFNIPLSLPELLLNLTAVNFTYNREWWYVRCYLIFLLISPLLFRFIRKSRLPGEIILLILLPVGYQLYFKILGPAFMEFPGVIITECLQWLPAFLTGILCAKYNLYKNFMIFLHRFQLDKTVVYFFGFLAACGLRLFLGRFGTGFDFIIAPFVIFFLVNIAADNLLQKILSFFGKHSVNMWLTHTFFCYYYVQHLLFSLKYSALIYIFLILLSLLSSYFVIFLYRLAIKIVVKLQNGKCF